MHDVGVAFDAEEFRHPDAADLGHPAHVVAPQVHQHQVLGPLLGVGQQLRLQRLVFGRRGAPGPGAGDGPVADLAVLQAHQDLRRGPHHLHVALVQVEHVGRRVDEAQGPVEVEGVVAQRRV